MSVDDHLSQVRHQLVGPVAGFLNLKKTRFILNEVHRHGPFPKFRMPQNIGQERHIGFDSPNPEFSQCAKHFATSPFKLPVLGRNLHQHGIEEGRNADTLIDAPGIQANTKSRGRTISGDHPVIGFKIIFRILGSNPALKGVALQLNLFLGRNLNGVVKKRIT